MKLFIISLATLLVLTAAVSVNSIYISKKCTSLISTAQRLPEFSSIDENKYTNAENLLEDTADSLSEEWEKCRFLICLSISHNDARVIDELLCQVRTMWASHDAGGYTTACALLIDRLNSIRKSERITLEGIL